MKIDIQEFKKAIDYINLINSTPLDELVIYFPTADIEHTVPENVVKEWQYIGLNNSDFLEKFLEENTPGEQQ